MTEVINPIFDLDQSYDRDVSIIDKYYSKVYDQATGTTIPNASLTTKTHFKFLVSDRSSWVHLAGAFLRIQFRVDKAALGNNTTVVSNIQSIFKRCILRANGVTLHDSSQYQECFADIDSKFWPAEYAKDIGSSIMLYPSNMFNDAGWNFIHRNTIGLGNLLVTTTGADPTVIGEADVITNWNSPLGGGVSTRFGLTDNSTVNGNVINCYVPLYHVFPFIRYYNQVINNVQWEIELYRQDNHSGIIFGDGKVRHLPTRQTA